MVSLKPGDRVDCRLKGSNIVTAYNDYDEIRTFEIVAKDDEGYYLFVPCYLYTNGGSILDAAKARRMGIASRFIGEKITYIAESSICRVVHKGISNNHYNTLLIRKIYSRIGSFSSWFHTAISALIAG